MAPRPPVDRLDRACDALLALGIILSGASSLRVGGVPIGPGEGCLLGWLVVRGSREAWFRPSPPSPLAGLVLGLWLLFATAQAVGLLRAVADEVAIDWPAVTHDAASYTVMALLTVLCLCPADHALRLGRTMRDATALGAVVLSLQVASAVDLVAVPGIDPWYWDRFRGWADNPNQLSLFCAILVPIALAQVERATRLADRLPPLCCAASALAAGLLTKGNSLRLALAVGACLGLAVLGYRLLSARGRRARRGTALALILVGLGLPLAGLSLLPLLAALGTENLAGQMSRDGAAVETEAALRFELWGDAVRQGVRASYLGLGPGPHAGIPAAIVVRQRWEPTADDPSLGDVAKHGAVMESHNSYLELFSQGGLAAVIAYLGFLALAMRQALRSGSLVLPALVCVVAEFGIFHVVLRHPIVWFALCLCVGAARVRGPLRSSAPPDRFATGFAVPRG